MQAYEMMNTRVFKVKETDTVRAVVEKMIDHRISGLPVVNERNEITAFISDGDIMRYIGKQRDIIIDSIFYVSVIKGDEGGFEERVQRILDEPVLAVAKRKVITAAWNEEVEDIAAVLGKKQIKKLPVERNGVLVGIISRGDVIRHSFKSFL